MKKNHNFLIFKIIFAISIFFVAIISCKDEKNNKNQETFLTGKATLYVDENIASIVEDEVVIFQNQYPKAEINIVAKPESEIINALIKDKTGLAILTRKLSNHEETVFRNKKIKARTTVFGSDAVVLIGNKKHKDSVVNISEITNLLQGKESKIKRLVFDNPNSGTVHYLDSVAKIETIENKKNIFSMKSEVEVLKFVSQNDDVIGVIGYNSIAQPNAETSKYYDNIKVLGVDNVKFSKGKNLYYKPNQSNIADGSYPLQRKMYLLNYQGKNGLGMGFAVFLANEIGQLIVLKSGLVPIRVPHRTIETRKKILKNN